MSAKKNQFFFVKCCNPFSLSDHKATNNLRPVTEWMCQLDSYILKKDMKICDPCRKLLSNEKEKNCIDDDDNDNGFFDPVTIVILLLKV